MRPKSFNMLCMNIWIVRVYEVYRMIHCSMFHPCDLSQCSFIRSPLICDHNRSRQHIVLYYLKKRSSFSTSYRNEKGFFRTSFYSSYISLASGMIAAIMLGTKEKPLVNLYDFRDTELITAF
jgi:hypothetical protein